MRPGLAYRTFWTWDHSTNWELSQVGQQEIGVFNPYGKPPGGFLADYQRVVDFCSRNRIAAVVIYGFLRDPHGGIETAQELCRYATERGVRILPGIAIGSYGGVLLGGRPPLQPRHLAARTTRSTRPRWRRASASRSPTWPSRSTFPRSDYTLSACPSAPETMAWMEEGVAWLAETFDIGGINIEAGDYGVCGCDRCVARRANEAEAARRVDDFGDSWSHTDMADNFPRLYRTAKAVKPDLWLYSEIQWDNLLDPVAHEAQRRLPRGGIYQHTTNRSYWSRIKAELTRGYVESLPTQPNVLRCQFACQWNGDERTERYALNARVFADMARLCGERGMHGLTVWGEPSPYHATRGALLPRLRTLQLGSVAHLGAFHGATRRHRCSAGPRRPSLRRHRRGDSTPTRSCRSNGCGPARCRPWLTAPTTRPAGAGSASRTRSLAASTWAATSPGSSPLRAPPMPSRPRAGRRRFAARSRSSRTARSTRPTSLSGCEPARVPWDTEQSQRCRSVPPAHG